VMREVRRDRLAEQNAFEAVRSGIVR